MQIGYREGACQCGLNFHSHSYAENEFWGEMDQVDKVVHIHCKFLYVGQWNPCGLLPKLKGFKAG